MFSIEKAKIVIENRTKKKMESVTQFKELYVFKTADSDWEIYPFYAFNKNTGESRLFNPVGPHMKEFNECYRDKRMEF